MNHAFETQPHFNWDLPPAQPVLAGDEIHVWCANLDIDPSSRERLASVISENEQKRAAQFHFEIHQHRFAVGRGLLRTILARYLDIAPSKIEFNYTDRGKPRLARNERVHFNLAHSANVALYAVTTCRELGVDVEAIRPIAEFESIARRFFSEAETTRLMCLPEGRRAEAFFNCWTRKEAFLKATGEGITAPLDQFEVSLDPGAPAELLSIRANRDEAQRWELHDLRPAAGHVGAIAIESHGLKPRCWRWDPVNCL